mmetsp:Transcript_6130/g.15057  ORF Transcript_6130/g.15057 Transcript_6130/m.15057 type:complete len:253 (+) Transcript_6130:1566-2324(+)
MNLAVNAMPNLVGTTLRPRLRYLFLELKSATAALRVARSADSLTSSKQRGTFQFTRGCPKWVESPSEYKFCLRNSVGATPRVDARWSMMVSLARRACGPPNPRKAVLLGRFVLHARPWTRRTGHLYELSMWNRARSRIGPERSSEQPASLMTFASRNASLPVAGSAPARYRKINGCRWPVIAMSTSRSRHILTGRFSTWAASAAVTPTNTLRVSFPPKPPPIRFIRQLTLCAGRPHTCAQKFCVFTGFCVDE